MPRSQSVVSLFGVLFVVAAAWQAGLKLAAGGPPDEAAIDFVLMSLPGVLLLYVGSWLSRSDLDSDLHRRIVGWCFGGVAVMLVFLVLRAVHPGVESTFSFGERALALAIGSIAGLGIGVHEAAAITTRRALEARNEELQSTREELQDAVDRLEASNERLDSFASTASHDLREPLRVISNYLRLLDERHGDELDGDAQEFLDFAVDGAERLRTMVDDLLAYSRVETQGDPFEPVDLDAVLDDVRRDLGVRIEETGARITVEPLPRVRGDESQLRQLFQNLLSNAIQYSDGPPRVHVSAAEDGDAWAISVRDEGIGIALEEQERIFELFQRLHGVGERPGSGIGLALCRRIVERHGGDIRVDSEPGDGSTFSVTLPRASERSVSPEASSGA